MNDIEVGDSKMASLRQRKNLRDNSSTDTSKTKVIGEASSGYRAEESLTTTSSSSRYEKLTDHSRLVRQINNANDDDDEEEREFKRIVVQQQMQSSQEMIKSMMRLLLMISGTVVILFIYLSVGETPSNQNASSLTKALRILLGMKNKRRVGLPPSARIVSSTSVMKNDLEDFIYPSWSWRGPSANKVQYLVGDGAEDEPIRQILHRKLSIKANVDVDVELFDRNDMYLFLSGVHGEQCQAAINDSDANLSVSGTSENISMLEQFQVFGDYGQKDGQRALWIWCMIHSKQAYGFIDLEGHEFKLNRNLIHDLSAGKLQNLFIGLQRDIAKDNGVERISHSSILFLPEQGKSTVAIGMLQHLTKQIESSKEAAVHLIQESEEKMLALIGSESDVWTPLHVICDNKKAKRSLIEVCADSNSCCSIMSGLDL